jgi:hypothetical protein
MQTERAALLLNRIGKLPASGFVRPPALENF